MAKVNFFPFRQSICMVYTPGTMGTKLFPFLYIQVSPKNSLAFRFLKSKLVTNFRSWVRGEFETPNDANSFIGILKSQKQILFELVNNEPIKVWKKSAGSDWLEEEFLGYPLVSEYSLGEFVKQKQVIKQGLQLHWEAVNSSLNNVHGDLTHFNILHNVKGAFFFIDHKDSNHSKLFDFFYFYAYFQQCVSRCSTIVERDKLKIGEMLKEIIKDVCVYDSKKDFAYDISNFNLPEVHGLINLNESMKEFISIWDKSF